MEQIFTWIRIALSLSFLTYSSWSDFKSREVSNTVWKVFAPLALLVTSTQFLFYPPFSRFLLLPYLDAVANAFVNYGISFGLTSIFSVALFYVGAFGGADAKALMCIALVLPAPPNLYPPLSGFVSFVFPITIFSNGVIVAAMSLFYALFRNLIWKLRTHQDLFEGYESESFWRKALALLCGYKLSVEDLEKSFSYPLEDLSTVEGALAKRLLLFPKDENREHMVEKI
ncbi:MAG: A24 family peptidase, partial [Candidatus Bathyarchaeota archaeon]|nr:A24 family peptidase [Candidatus Bathyarchaeota archaeon]